MPDDGKTLVKIRDLHFSRGSNAIFRGLNVDIPRGKVTTILGPSGTGKTTLLKMIGGQLLPSKGSITVDGLDVARLSRRKLYALRKRLGMLFQSGALLTDLSVFENVAFDPMMIMYDEPFTGQDPISMGVLLELISTVNSALGLTSLMVSHDLGEAISISDYLVVISEGVVVEAGTPDQLKSSKSNWVQQFLQGKPDGPVPFQVAAPDYETQLLGPAR